MTKKLRSAVAKEELEKILGGLPRATAVSSSKKDKILIEENKSNQSLNMMQDIKKVKTKTISASVTPDLKMEIAKYLASHPEESERSLILKGLKYLGFSISDYELIDKRTRK